MHLQDVTSLVSCSVVETRDALLGEDLLVIGDLDLASWLFSPQLVLKARCAPFLQGKCSQGSRELPTAAGPEGNKTAKHQTQSTRRTHQFTPFNYRPLSEAQVLVRG